MLSSIERIAENYYLEVYFFALAVEPQQVVLF